jgi:Co/Zn/Cd efflux system component
MLIIATAGLPINIIMYFVLHSGSNHSHGLMGEKCGEEFNIEENENSNVCLEIIC